MMRVLALLTAVVGGLCWVARWGADLAGSDPGWGDTAHAAGLVLLGVALAGAGARLVSRSAVWLRVIVGIAAPLLVWSVYAVIRGDRDGILLDGVVGLVAVVTAVTMMLLGSGSGARSARASGGRRHAGSHAR